MRKIIKNTDLVPVVIQDLTLDSVPTAGSTNPVTSDGVKGAIDGAVGDASEALQEQINDIAEKAGSGYIPKGEASVATLNALSGQENGDLYTMTDSGTLTDGSLAVVAGDTVAWDATNEVWYKAMDYAPRQYGTNEVHNLPTTITAFRTGDCIAVDGTDTAKMSKDDLLRETAENAYPSNITASLEGNDNTLVKYDLNIRFGVEYVIYPKDLDWLVAQNDLGYGVTGFAIYYVAFDDTEVRMSSTLVGVGAGESSLEKPLDSEYKFTIPINAKKAYIGARAKSGETIVFNVSPVVIVNEEKITNVKSVIPNSVVGSSYYSIQTDFSGKKGLYKFAVSSPTDSASTNLNGMYLRIYNTSTSSWVTVISQGSNPWENELIIDFDFSKIEIKFVSVSTAVKYIIEIIERVDRDFCFKLNESIQATNTRIDNLKQISFNSVITGQGQTQVTTDITSKIVKGCSYKIVPSNTNWSVDTNPNVYSYNGFVIRSVKNGVNTNYVNIQIPAGQNQLAHPLDSEYIVKVPLDCDSFVILIRATNGTSVSFNLSLSTYQPNEDEDEITNMYPSKVFLPKIGTLKKQTPAGWSPQNTPVSLLWFSDIHGDVNNVKRIVKFKSEYSTFIDDVLNTGDSVTDNLGDYSVYQQMLDAGADKFLVSIGNHDVTSANYTTYKGWSGNTSISDIYDKFVGEMDVSGVTLAGANKNYYYKDYTTGAVTTKGVRLVVLDSCINVSALTQSGSGISPTETASYVATQLSWLESVLADAITNNLAVVIATHGVNAGTDIQSPFGFTGLDSVIYDPASTMDSDYLDAVDAFIAGGGEFICWICGHQHSDHIASITGHANQMQIMINTATARSYYSKQSQPYRTGYDGAEPITYTTDAFDIISFDTYYKQVKLVRVGCNYDAWGRHIDMVTYNYQTKSLVNG